MGLEALIPLAGGLLSSQESDGPSQESKKEPWAPAIPWLTSNLKTGQDLQKFYQQNPFGAQQKIGMQNQLGMADQFQGQMMPGLMDFANKGMTSSYQRGAGGARPRRDRGLRGRWVWWRTTSAGLVEQRRGAVQCAQNTSIRLDRLAGTKPV